MQALLSAALLMCSNRPLRGFLEELDNKAMKLTEGYTEYS